MSKAAKAPAAPSFETALAELEDIVAGMEGGELTLEGDAAEEKERIAKELQGLSSQADFPLEVKPVALARTISQANKLAHGDHDVLLLYAAGGGVDLLESLTAPGKWNIMFLRHDSGPAYLWYEIVHPRFLRKTVDNYGQAVGMSRMLLSTRIMRRDREWFERRPKVHRHRRLPLPT